MVTIFFYMTKKFWIAAEVTLRKRGNDEGRTSYKCCLVGTCVLCSTLQFHSETYAKAPYGMKLSGVLNPSHDVYFCTWTRDYSFSIELPKSSSKAIVTL